MGREVEQQVVQMQFENGQFEKAAKQTLNTVESLKKDLDLQSTARAMANSGIAEAMDKIADAVSLKGTFIRRFIENLASDIYAQGKRMLNSLTVEPISQGFEEYELKMGSVQTIMASTGESLETVNGYLDELNVYADRTIYSFADMTQNIGKFTNAGVKLDKAVAAIQGISNEAALSGANANEASRAMYNFAQALSSGAVRLIDWKSIENANMATVEFKQQLIDTAVELGMLTKTTDGMYQTLDKKVKFDATKSFNDSLQKQWMTADVLIDTLSKYSDETTDLGKRAYAAAQDVKTFTQLMDTLKEAAGSGWEQTWETLFGNFEEAKELWTGVSQVIGGFIDESSDARNNLLATWKDMGGRTILIKSIANVFESLRGIALAVGKALETVFPPITAQRLFDMTVGFRNFSQQLKQVFAFTYDSSEVISSVGNKTYKTNTTVWTFGETLQKIWRIVAGVGSVFGILIDGLTEVKNLFFDLVKWALPGGEGLLEWLANIGDYLVGVRTNLKETGFFKTWGKTVKEAFSAVPPALSNLKASFVSLYTALRDWFVNSGIMEKVSSGLSTFFSDLIDAIPLVIVGISDFIDGAFEWLRSNEYIQVGISKLSAFVSAIIENAPILYNGVKQFVKGLFGYEDGAITLSGVFKELGAAINAFLTELIGFDEDGGSILKQFLDDIFPQFRKSAKTADEEVAEPTKSFAEKLIDAATNIKETLASVGASIHDTIAWIFEKWQEYDVTSILEKAFGFWAGGTIISWVGSFRGVNKSLGGVLKGLSGIFEAFSKNMNTIGKGTGGVLKSISGVFDDFWKNITGIAKEYKKRESVGTTLLKMAVALGVVVGAIYVLSKIPSDQFVPAAKRLGILALALLGFGYAFKKLSGGGIPFQDIGSQIFKMALGIVVLVGAMYLISKMDIDALVQGLVGLGAILIELGLFFGGTKGAGFGDNAKLLTMAISVLLLVGAVKSLAKMDYDKMVQGLIGLGAILFELGIFMRLANGANLAGFVGLGLALLSIVRVIKQVAKMTRDDLKKGLFAVGAMLAELIVVSRLMGSNVSIGAGIAFIGIAVALLAMLYVIKKIAKINSDDLGKGIGVLTILLTEITAVTRFMGPGMKITRALGFLIAFAGALVLFLGALYFVRNYDPAQMIAFGVSFGVMLVGFAAVAFALNSMSAGTFAGAVAKIGGMIGVIIILAGLLSMFDDFLNGGVTKFISGAGDILGQIGQAIGAFVGGIVSGIGVGLTSGMPTIATNLSTFMENGAGFFEGAAGITEDMAAGVGRLALMIAEISGAEIIAGISTLVNLGKDPIQKFVDQLKILGPGLLRFSLYASGLNTDAVDGAANAASMLASFAKEVPSTSLIDALAGSSNIENFSNTLPGLGENLAAFAESVKDLDTNASDNGAAAASMLASFAKEVPSTSLIDALAGSSNIENFSNTLPGLGTNLTEFATAVSGLPDNAVDNAIDAASMLASFAAEIPATSLLDVLFGSNLEKFSKNLPDLGSNIAKFAANFTGQIGDGDVDAATAAGRLLASFAQEIPSVGLLEALLGTSNLQSFADALPNLGTGLNEFVANTKDIQGEDDVKGAVAALSLLSSFATTELPQAGIFESISKLIGGSTWEEFGTAMAGWGTGIKNLYESVSDITNWTPVTNAVENMRTIAAIVRDLNEGAYLDWQYAGTQFSDWETSGLGSFLSALTNWGTLPYETGASFAQALSDGIDSVASLLPTNFETIAEDALNMFLKKIGSYAIPIFNVSLSLSDAFRRGLNAADFYTTGQNAVQGYINGIRSMQTAAYQAGALIGQASLLGTQIAIDAHSPAKKFGELGNFSVEGYVGAFFKGLDSVYSAGEKLGQTALDAAKTALAHIDAVVNSDLDLQPTIRPVLDTTAIVSGAKTINGVLSEVPLGFGIRNSGLYAQNASYLSGLQNLGAYTQSNQKIVDAINTLNDRVDSLGDRIANLRMVTDTGVLAGQMQDTIDHNLGVITIRKGRGN